MTRMVITHAVENTDRWLEGKEERATALGKAASNVTDFVADDGSARVAVTLDVQDVDALKAMVDSPPADLVSLMQKHGVVPPFTVYIES